MHAVGQRPHSMGPLAAHARTQSLIDAKLATLCQHTVLLQERESLNSSLSTHTLAASTEDQAAQGGTVRTHAGWQAPAGSLITQHTSACTRVHQ
jgi:hypothetical protein